VVSVAYIDPGNWGSNIAAGSHFGFSLLWVVWLSGFLAVYFQYLAGLVGTSGAGLLDLFEARLKKLASVGAAFGGDGLGDGHG